MTLDIFTEDQRKQLADNLDPKHVKTLTEGSKAQYIEGWHAIAEANRIFGFGGWDCQTIRLEQTNKDLVKVKRQVRNETVMENQWRVGYLAVVRVTVYGADGSFRVREGTGFGSGHTKELALSDAIEKAAKEAETDAFKRAVRNFGNPFGLALYDKTKSMVGASNLEEEAEPTEKKPPPPAQQKIADGLLADFEMADDPDALWRHPNTKKYLKAWYQDKSHNLYEQMVKAAQAARKRIADQDKEPDEGEPGNQRGPRDGVPFDDEIPF